METSLDNSGRPRDSERSKSDQERLRVDLDTQVEIEFYYIDGERETQKFAIVSEEQADYYAGFLGACTPLALAIMGQDAGSVIEYQAGDVREVQILSVKPAPEQEATDRAALREQVIRKAVAE